MYGWVNFLKLNIVNCLFWSPIFFCSNELRLLFSKQALAAYNIGWCWYYTLYEQNRTLSINFTISPKPTTTPWKNKEKKQPRNWDSSHVIHIPTKFKSFGEKFSDARFLSFVFGIGPTVQCAGKMMEPAAYSRSC